MWRKLILLRVFWTNPFSIHHCDFISGLLQGVVLNAYSHSELWCMNAATWQRPWATQPLSFLYTRAAAQVIDYLHLCKKLWLAETVQWYKWVQQLWKQIYDLEKSCEQVLESTKLDYGWTAFPVMLRCTHSAAGHLSTFNNSQDVCCSGFQRSLSCQHPTMETIYLSVGLQLQHGLYYVCIK